MALAVQIQPNNPSIACEQDASAECAFDVTNTSGKPQRVGIEVLSEHKWIALADESQNEMILPNQALQKIKVKATPGSAAPESYTFKLRVYDPDTAEAVESGAVAVEVKEKPKPKPPVVGPTPGPKPPNLMGVFDANH